MVNDTVKKALESLYEGLCSVYEYKQVKDATTQITGKKEVLVLTDIPCRLSSKSVVSSNQSENVNYAEKEIKLFLSKDIEIKAGSKIVVTQNGVTNAYKNSGVPAVHSNHQEIVLEIFKEWT